MRYTVVTVEDYVTVVVGSHATFMNRNSNHFSEVRLWGKQPSACRPEKTQATEERMTVAYIIAILGKYKRGEAEPSIDFAKRIADALGVTLDYLVGEGQSASLDKKNVQRQKAIEQLPEDEKKTVFALLDAFIRNFRAKQQYAV